MRNISKIIITIFIFINSQANAQIFEKDYFSIFSKYKVTDKTKVQKIVNFCVDKLGKNNIKITRNNDGEVIISHKKEKEFLDCTYANILNVIKPTAAVNAYPKKKLKDFLLNNEITFDDGLGNGEVTYYFEDNGYIKLKEGKEIGTDGWRWSKLGQLRVFMNGEKTTWRFSKDLLALSIKKGTNKATPFFFEYENKNIAKKRRENLIAEKKLKKKE